MDAGPSAVILFVREIGFQCAITHTGVESRLWSRWRRSGHVRCNFVRSQTGFQCAITHTGVECRLWRRSDHVRRNFVRSQTGFQCAITHTGSKSRLWRRSGHASVPAARVEISRRCVIRNCEWINWILYGHTNADTAYLLSDELHP